MKIAFHSNQLGERGTEVALYDYAYFNESLLNNKSIIISKKSSNLVSLDKFKKRFKVFLYEDFSEVDGFLEKENANIFYAIKAGHKDGIAPKVCKTVVHCVFDVSEPHGDVYAAISESLAEKSRDYVSVVPHMINLPDTENNFRKTLAIPDDAIVFGRHGGFDTFDIDFVYKVIKKIVKKRKDIYFLFLNTKPFYKNWFSRSHQQIIHLSSTTDLFKKVEFINTCDAMLHARKKGETFGIAVGEFSIKNKPIFTWRDSKDKAHLKILKDKAIIYNDQSHLYRLIQEFDPNWYQTQNWDAYSLEYSPQKVMASFEEVFLGG